MEDDFEKRGTHDHLLATPVMVEGEVYWTYDSSDRVSGIKLGAFMGGEVPEREYLLSWPAHPSQEMFDEEAEAFRQLHGVTDIRSGEGKEGMRTMDLAAHLMDRHSTPLSTWIRVDGRDGTALLWTFHPRVPDSPRMGITSQNLTVLTDQVSLERIKRTLERDRPSLGGVESIVQSLARTMGI